MINKPSTSSHFLVIPITSHNSICIYLRTAKSYFIFNSIGNLFKWNECHGLLALRRMNTRLLDPRKGFAPRKRQNWRRSLNRSVGVKRNVAKSSLYTERGSHIVTISIPPLPLAAVCAGMEIGKFGV